MKVWSLHIYVEKNVSSTFCLETKTNFNTLEDGKELKRIAETHLSNLLEMTGY